MFLGTSFTHIRYDARMQCILPCHRNQFAFFSCGFLIDFDVILGPIKIIALLCLKIWNCISVLCMCVLIFILVTVACVILLWWWQWEKSSSLEYFSKMMKCQAKLCELFLRNFPPDYNIFLLPINFANSCVYKNNDIHVEQWKCSITFN